LYLFWVIGGIIVNTEKSKEVIEEIFRKIIEEIRKMIVHGILGR